MRKLNTEEEGLLYVGLTTLLRSPSLVCGKHFQQVVHTLATAGFVGLLQERGEAPRQLLGLAAEFAPPLEERWVALVQAAKTVGKSPDTLRRWCRNDIIPSYAYRKVGRNWQVELDELQRWLDED